MSSASSLSAGVSQSAKALSSSIPSGTTSVFSSFSSSSIATSTPVNSISATSSAMRSISQTRTNTVSTDLAPSNLPLGSVAETSTQRLSLGVTVSAVMTGSSFPTVTVSGSASATKSAIITGISTGSSQSTSTQSVSSVSTASSLPSDSAIKTSSVTRTPSNTPSVTRTSSSTRSSSPTPSASNGMVAQTTYIQQPALLFSFKLSPASMAAFYKTEVARAFREALSLLLGVPAEVIIITAILDPRSNKMTDISSVDIINTHGNIATIDDVASELASGGDGSLALSSGGSSSINSNDNSNRRRLLLRRVATVMNGGGLAPGRAANASAVDLSVAFLAYARVPLASVDSTDSTSKLTNAIAMKGILDRATVSGLYESLALGLDSLADAQGLPPGSVGAVLAPGTSSTAILVTRAKTDWSLRAWLKWVAGLPLAAILGGTLSFVALLIGFFVWRCVRKRRSLSKAKVVPLLDTTTVVDMSHSSPRARNIINNTIRAGSDNDEFAKDNVLYVKDDNSDVPYDDGDDDGDDAPRNSDIRRKKRTSPFSSNNIPDKVNSDGDFIGDFDGFKEDEEDEERFSRGEFSRRNQQETPKTHGGRRSNVLVAPTSLRGGGSVLRASSSSFSNETGETSSHRISVGAKTVARVKPAAVQERRLLAARAAAALDPLRLNRVEGRGAAPLRSGGGTLIAARLAPIGPTPRGSNNNRHRDTHISQRLLVGAGGTAIVGGDVRGLNIHAPVSRRITSREDEEENS